MALETIIHKELTDRNDVIICWRNCRNELEGVRAAAAACERALAVERAAAADARAQRDLARRKLSIVEKELAQHEALLSAAEAEEAALRRGAEERRRELERAAAQLRLEREARAQCSAECAALSARVAAAAQETSELRATVELTRAELQRVARALQHTQAQLDMWPRPLTKMLCAARSWLRHPLSLPEALLWALVPARHGC
ncbi:uncharacterized protein LOC114351707 [Ostrinia furnacalis]|uniref:uncharacterized protein LOC114351707 n=1 Tax=Ostrinia furnacalis TaxID=93504 RepID=UPI00103A3B70|nr:uncharacterized protein LOC114351707 [Ostrinia furnacalis]